MSATPKENLCDAECAGGYHCCLMARHIGKHKDGDKEWGFIEEEAAAMANHSFDPANTVVTHGHAVGDGRARIKITSD